MKKSNNHFPSLPKEKINKPVEELTTKNKCGDFAPCSDCQQKDYLECCDECQRVLCIKCLGLCHGSEYLFCQNCFDKKSKEEKAIMRGEKKALFSWKNNKEK
jgi:hypothetical protein